jgi:hypothetical protein
VSPLKPTPCSGCGLQEDSKPAALAQVTLNPSPSQKGHLDSTGRRLEDLHSPRSPHLKDSAQDIEDGGS